MKMEKFLFLIFLINGIVFVKGYEEYYTKNVGSSNNNNNNKNIIIPVYNGEDFDLDRNYSSGFFNFHLNNSDNQDYSTLITFNPNNPYQQQQQKQQERDQQQQQQHRQYPPPNEYRPPGSDPNAIIPYPYNFYTTPIPSYPSSTPPTTSSSSSSSSVGENGYSYGPYDPYYGLLGDIQPRVNVPLQGSVVGGIDYTLWSRRKFYKFLGIKYGHVGRGDKRFQKPEPVRPWGSEFNATVEPPQCPSFPNLNRIRREEHIHELEDCLSISIYSSNLNVFNPVMFYIHGEFFFDGTSQEARPHYLMEKDIVLVTVEYRLAPFGFISTLNERLPGNAAVTDVLAALKWIQRNIQYFGGDPRKVTIFGQGAGASMAHLLSISPYVEPGLFHQVILQSGTALNPYLLTDNPIKHTRDIANKAGCNGANDLDRVTDCLSRLSTSELLSAFLKHCQSNEQYGVGNYGGFQLVIGDSYGIIPKHPIKMASEYNGINYPIIGGVTKTVGSFFYSKIFPYIQNSEKQDLESLIDLTLKHTLGEEDDYGVWKNIIIRELFTETIHNSTDLELISGGLIDLVSAILYKAPLLEALQQNAKFDPNGTYLYTFDYKGQFTRYGFPPNKFEPGVSLSDDNIYLFPYPDHVASLDEKDREIANIIIELWTSFACTGIPSAPPKITEWPQMHYVSGPYIEISTGLVQEDFVVELPVFKSVFDMAEGFLNLFFGKLSH